MQKPNYQKMLESIIAAIPEGEAPTLLLHSCCAPCSSYCLEYLAQYFRITLLYYNPNISPEDEFRKRNIHAIWIPHALPDSRTVSRAEIRRIINDYMTTVMHEEPLDPSLLEFDDSMSW